MPANANSESALKAAGVSHLPAKPKVGFVGWIPNISGRLSFGSLTSWRNTLSPKQVSVQDDLLVRRRVVLAHHQRVTNDGFFSILGRALTQFYRPLSLRSSRRISRLGLVVSDAFDYFLILHGNECDDLLEGRAFVLNSPRAELSVRRAWVKQFRSAIKLGSKHNRGVAQEFSEDGVAGQDIDRLIQKIASSKTSSLLHAKVRVERCGTCHISDLEISCGSKLSIDDTWNASDEAKANQIYRFVRDLFHSHYHHHWAEDCLTSVTQADGTYRWIHNARRQIYRALISCRRAGSEEGLAQAAGHLSYLKSLNSVYPKELAAVAPVRNLDSLESSISSAQNSVSAKKNGRRIAVTALAVLPFGIFTFLVSLTRAVSETSTNKGLENFFRHCYELLSGNLVLAAVMLLAVAVIYYRVFSAEKFINIGIVKEFHRALRSWSEGGQSRAKRRTPRAIFIIALLVLGMLACFAVTARYVSQYLI